MENMGVVLRCHENLKCNGGLLKPNMRLWPNLEDQSMWPTLESTDFQNFFQISQSSLNKHIQLDSVMILIEILVNYKHDVIFKKKSKEIVSLKKRKFLEIWRRSH